jgi:Na+/H+-translocating membrane pyrophosphatase
MGLLTGTISTGFLVAIMMANSGGAWDNAKKYIEADHFGGKNSPAHDSSIVGDTVGDPFKDTTGPSINILIKLMSIVSVIFAWAAYAWGEEGIITLLNMHWPG